LTENGASEKLGHIGAMDESPEQNRPLQRKKGVPSVRNKERLRRLKKLTGVVNHPGMEV
jgi:hypothetical protein